MFVYIFWITYKLNLKISCSDPDNNITSGLCDPNNNKKFSNPKLVAMTGLKTH